MEEEDNVTIAEPSSIGSDEMDLLLDTDLNPEGYGIEGEFVPMAVFDDKPPDSQANLFGGDEDEAPGTKPVFDVEAHAEDAEEGGEEGSLEEEGDEGEEAEAEVEGGEDEGIEEGIEEKEGEEEGEEGEGEDEESSESEKDEEEEAEEGEEEGEEGGKEEEPTEEEKVGVKFGGDEVEGEAVAQKVVKKEVFKRRASMRKKSIFYPTVSRFRAEDRRVSGDFAAIATDMLGSLGSPPSIASYEPEAAESLEEELEEEETVPINREYFYAVYKSLAPEHRVLKMKNNFLQRKMADYFRKRKMEHVLKETDQQIDSQAKYEKKLDALAELTELDRRERHSISTELNDMRDQRNEQRDMLDQNFAAMQSREIEIGTGLINTKTGKEIPPKLIEHQLRRQLHKANEIAKMRLLYIKIRDRVQEKKDALHALDCIGDNLHLIDYEQLKIENQSHTDKIEERDEELNKLRIKCQAAMQCLAHVREKSAAVLIDVQQLNERYEEIEMEYMDCRENINYYKQERDRYRFEIEKLSDDCGLLTRPKLLRDMERSMEAVQIKSKAFVNLKEETERLASSLKAIKKNIALAPTKLHVIKPPPEPVTESSRRIYKGRPTLIYPQLPHSENSEFDMP